MKLLQVTKSIRNAALTLAIALIAIIAVAPTANAAGVPDGQAGDHHAEAAQGALLHWSSSIMFWEYVTFGIVLVILGVVVFPKLLGQLSERSKGIADAQDKAEKVLAEAHELEAKNQEKLNNAHVEAKKITDEAIVAAKEVEARIRAEADNAAKEIREKAEAELAQMTKAAKAELREQAVELALMAAGKVIEKSMTDDDHRRLAKEAIDATEMLRN